MSSKSLIAGLALVFGFGSNAMAQDVKFLSAMDLAIEHFNADGSKPVQSWGPEHTFMYTLLSTVETEFPQLAGIGKESAIGADERFSSLQLELELTKEKLVESQAVLGKFATLVDGCGYRRQTTIDEQDIGFTTPSKSTRVSTTFEFAANPRATRQCSSATAKKLGEMGLARMVITETAGSYYDTAKVSLDWGTNLWQDMRFVKAQAMALPEVDASLIDLLNVPAPGQFIGTSSDITLVGSSGKAAATDAFVLVFYKGEGDCPSGCIHKTYTTVEVTPKIVPAGSKPQFDLKIVPNPVEIAQ